MSLLSEGEEFEGFLVGGCIHRGETVQLYRVKYAQGMAEPGFPMVLKLAAGGGADAWRCEVEQLVLPALAGAGVPRFVTAGRVHGRPYLVREYVSGRTLQQWLQPAERLPVQEALRLALALARAVHELHAQQVLHLDLQPGHVLVRDDGSVALLGLGRAWHAHWPDVWAGLAPDADLISPYAGVEQAQAVRDDPRSDIHAIGALLYQMLTGTPPYPPLPATALAWRRHWRPPAPPRQQRPLLPPWLQEVVLRCLAVEARQRYASVAQLVFDLQHPQQVRLGPRAHASGRAGLWLQALPALRPRSAQADAGGAPPLVLAVLPLQGDAQPLQHAWQAAVTRALADHAQARLLCVALISPVAAEAPEDAAPQRLQQARLQHWVRALERQGQPLACRVLVAVDPAQAVLEQARANLVNHIVLALPDGAAAAQPWQALLAAAPCAVTLVRAQPQAGGRR